LTPAKPEAAKSKDNEASAPPPVDDKPPSLPISTRLACVLQDKKQPQRRWIKTIEMAPLLPRNYLDAQVQYDIDRGQITIDLGLQPQLLQVLRPEQKFQVKLDVESGVEVSTSGDDVAVLSAQQPHQQLSVKVGAEPPQDVVLSLSVNDWPRAFLYRVHCDRIARGPVPRYQPHRVKITEPAADYAKQPAAELTAKIQVDAGDADFPRIHEHVAAAGNGSSQDRIVVGIDANRDREFSRNESQRQLYDTRQIDLQLRFEPPQRISVATHVSDFEVQLESQGLKDTVVHLRAELWTMSDDKVSKLMSTADPVSVRIDGRGPQFSKLDLPTRVEKGKPLEFSVEVVDQELESASGVRDVRFVIVEPGASANQGNKQHTWGEKEEAAAIPLALDERNPARYWGAVATDGEKLRVKQSYTLLIQARDRVGNVENLPTKPFRVDAPSAAKAEMPRRFDLPVRVMFGTKPREGITVTVTGAAAPDPQPTSSDGRAVFKGLPPGKYTIEAQGAVAGYTKKSPKKEVELPFPPGAEAGVTVSLETP